MIDHLRQEKTPSAFTSKPGSNKEKEAFYNKVIDTFFDKKQLLQEFGKYPLAPSVKRKLDIVQRTINRFDQSLDSLDSGSIFIEPYRSSTKPVNSEEGLYNYLTIWIRQGQLKTFMLTFFFDEKTNKIISVSD